MTPSKIIPIQFSEGFLFSANPYLGLWNQAILNPE
jgi:hypothetical protein